MDDHTEIRGFLVGVTHTLDSPCCGGIIGDEWSYVGCTSLA